MQRFGELKVSLAQTQDEQGIVSLKNSLTVSFPGIEFRADDVNPAVVLLKDGSLHPLALSSFDENGESGVTFRFSELQNSNLEENPLDISIDFSSQGESLLLKGSFPEDASSLTLNFKPSSSFSVTEKAASRQVFSAKDSAYFLTASSLGDETITLSSQSPNAIFAPYTPMEHFSFAELSENFPAVSQYEQNVQAYKTRLLLELSEAMKNPSNLTESAVAVFVAEMAAQGKYAQSLSLVPDSFVRGNKRTFLTAPYFGQMEAMLPSLQMKVANIRSMIENAVSSDSEDAALTVLSQPDVAEFINVIGETQNVKKLLSIPSQVFQKEDFSFSLEQAVGIVRVYSDLISLRADSLAALLAPVLGTCVSTIEENCEISEDGSAIFLKNNENPLSGIEAGSVLISYGEKEGGEEIARTGRALVSSALEHLSDFSQLADAYSSVVKNPLYPHAQVLYREKGIWAWSGTEKIVYTERNDAGQIQFLGQTGDSSYTILTGIPNFRAISIYGINYRSDPQFERYASSGYVYKSAGKSLLLKTFHKVDSETVVLTY